MGTRMQSSEEPSVPDTQAASCLCSTALCMLMAAGCFYLTSCFANCQCRTGFDALMEDVPCPDVPKGSVLRMAQKFLASLQVRPKWGVPCVGPRYPCRHHCSSGLLDIFCEGSRCCDPSSWHRLRPGECVAAASAVRSWSGPLPSFHVAPCRACGVWAAAWRIWGVTWRSRCSLAEGWL